jgi:hypothetical protein
VWHVALPSEAKFSSFSEIKDCLFFLVSPDLSDALAFGARACRAFARVEGGTFWAWLPGVKTPGYCRVTPSGFWSRLDRVSLHYSFATMGFLFSFFVNDKFRIVRGPDG